MKKEYDLSTMKSRKNSYASQLRESEGNLDNNKTPALEQQATIRLSPDVVEYFIATGKGWQTRIDDVLREYVAEHS